MTTGQENEGENSKRRLSPTVVALGFVSLLTDISSEMVYTQIPLYLTTVLMAPPAIVGLIEGVAESTASLLKLVSGAISDRTGKRKPLTVLGYGFGAISKPLLALTTAWPGVLAVRFLDRLGKGLRTAPRDALIAESTPKEMRGRAFGLHRTMDTTGAVLGPLLGILFLNSITGEPAAKLRSLFLFAGVFGLLAVLTLLFSVREKAPPLKIVTAQPTHRTRRSLHEYWMTLDPAYRRFLFIVLLFNLGNSSDAFLILRAQQEGIGTGEMLALYATFNVVEALLGYAAGKLSDRVGRRPLIITGYFVFALVYVGFALAHSRTAIWLLFLLYGCYYTLTQGVQRAFAADLSDVNLKATQIGAYHTVVGIALLPASLVAGRLFQINPAFPFFVGAVTGLLSAFCLLIFPHKNRDTFASVTP